MPVVILIALALLVAGGSLFLGSLIRPQHPNKLKETAYECGEEPVGQHFSGHVAGKFPVFQADDASVEFEIFSIN